MPTSVPLADLDRLLLHAEKAVALDRCLPVNLVPEIERLATTWESLGPASPNWAYRSPPDLSDLLAALDRVVAFLPSGNPLGDLYGGRAHELWKEARIVEALGSDEFGARAAERFPVDPSEHGVLADRLANEWIRLPEPAEGVRVAADDASNPRSLISVSRSLVGQLRLPVRVVSSPSLASAAATGDGIIVVREGTTHSERAARRIALHEVHGHAMPRVRARAEVLGLFSAGTRSGSDDEEGRALLVEERHGLMDNQRRRELGLRHLAARAVRAGADWVDIVHFAKAHGARTLDAVRIATRVHRGGGLARELVYLPALGRVRAAFESDATIESWLERGRIGVETVPAMRHVAERLGARARQSNVAITGT